MGTHWISNVNVRGDIWDYYRRVNYNIKSEQYKVHQHTIIWEIGNKHFVEGN